MASLHYLGVVMRDVSAMSWLRSGLRLTTGPRQDKEGKWEWRYDSLPPNAIR
jgi:hypothetical protein